MAGSDGGSIGLARLRCTSTVARRQPSEGLLIYTGVARGQGPAVVRSRQPVTGLVDEHTLRPRHSGADIAQTAAPI